MNTLEQITLDKIESAVKLYTKLKKDNNQTGMELCDKSIRVFLDYNYSDSERDKYYQVYERMKKGDNR